MAGLWFCTKQTNRLVRVQVRYRGKGGRAARRPTPSANDRSGHPLAMHANVAEIRVHHRDGAHVKGTRRSTQRFAILLRLLLRTDSSAWWSRALLVIAHLL